MAVDMITVLDGILFDKPDTADIWTLDGGGQGNEVVKNYYYPLPTDISAARVIFNAAEATASAKYHCRVNLSKTTSLASGVPTKTQNTQVMEWSTVTSPAILESAEADVSAAITAGLHIDIALSSTTAVTAGLEVRVQVKKKSGLDEWTDLQPFTGPIGTGVKSDMIHNGYSNLAGQTNLGVTNPVTGKLDHIGRKIFIEDTATIAHCEIAFLVACGTDT
jgi:hypothetical protein